MPTTNSRSPEGPQVGPRGDRAQPDPLHTGMTQFEGSHDVSWALLGPQGLRAGWSAFLFIALYYLLTPVFDTVAVSLDPSLADPIFSPYRVLVTEFIPVSILAVLLLFMTRIEHRRIAEYHFADGRRLRHFLAGSAAGFVALSVLVFALRVCGWLAFAPHSLGGIAALKFGCVWAGAFLLVGIFEEGAFRGYLQFTLSRGINFWWALASVGALCLLVQFGSDPKGREGVYLVAALGVVPCWILQRVRAVSAPFWQAAWTTSTAFGYYHTNNSGENWIGILAAALIGFVFCASVRLTGSAWWAMGCHSAWDWAETYFYGTADSGFPAQRHLFSATARGDPRWSGGADGPEGSLLVVPVVLLLLVFLVAFYRQRNGKRVAV